MFLHILLPASLFLSFVPVLTVILLRGSVLHQRRRVIEDLAKALRSPRNMSNSGIQGIPSFELVKFKYRVEISETGQLIEKTKDIKLWQWLISTIPFAIILFFFSCYSVSAILRATIPQDILPNDFKLSDLDWIGCKSWGLQWIIVAAFAAGHIRTFSNLFRAVTNFDLSPSSFIDESIQFLIGMTSGIILYFAIDAVYPSYLTAMQTESMPNSGVSFVQILFSTNLIAAFAASYLPDVARRNIVKASKLTDYRLEDSTALAAAFITPIEVLDGIDADIRHKLEIYHINCVQNLAAANPLMVYVETPYGVYQVLDWVSQAQLCAAVGTRKLVKFWSLGIRTIFDLERFAHDPCCKNEDLLQLIGHIIFDGNGEIEPRTTIPTTMIIANITSMLQTEHVHRLRQIVMTLDEAVGEVSRRLPPINRSDAKNCSCCACLGATG